MEMGNGFAFLGKQREIIVGGRSRKIDLLFYHIRLRCYVVCELKERMELLKKELKHTKRLMNKN